SRALPHRLERRPPPSAPQREIAMPRPTDLMLAELMAARLCHDLVGSVGAVANGVELLGDSRSRPDPEVLELVAQSARAASRRLQAFRVAYGTGNALPSSGMFAEARRL